MATVNNQLFNTTLIFFAIAISSLFVLLNIYKPNALIAILSLYMIMYSAFVLVFLINYKKNFSNNMHYDFNWYSSVYNMILGVVMFALYFLIPR